MPVNGCGTWWIGIGEPRLAAIGIHHKLKDASHDVLALQAEWFRAKVPDDVVCNILARRGIGRVWELHEEGWVCQIDLSLLIPAYKTAEKYWTTGEMDWLIYASHESSITVAGAWLIEAIKEIWPSWQDHLYAGWENVRPSISAVSRLYIDDIAFRDCEAMPLAETG